MARDPGDEKDSVATNDRDDIPDSEMESLLRRVVERITVPADPEKARAFAEKCVEQVRRQKRRQFLGSMLALAASVCLVVFTGWFVLQSDMHGNLDLSAKAPPVRFRKALDQWVGPKGDTSDTDLYLSLPAVREDAWIAAIELRDGKANLLQITIDAACIQVSAGNAVELDIPFRPSDHSSARVLVVWSRLPCCSALASALRDGTIKSVAPDHENTLRREVAAIVNQKGNALLFYRFVPLVPEIPASEKIHD